VGVAGPWGLGLGVVGAEDFEGARVAGCSGGALEELELGVGGLEIGGGNWVRVDMWRVVCLVVCGRGSADFRERLCEGSLPCVCDDDVVEWGVLLAEAREAYP
jgi:hypothetical protein